MVEVSEVVPSLSRASTTCPRSLTILYDAYIVSRLFIRRPYTTRTCLFSLTFAQSLLTLLSLSLPPPSHSFSLPPLCLFLLLFLVASPSLCLNASLSVTLTPRRPTRRSPLSYRLPFSRLSAQVFLFFCLFPRRVTTSANERATRLGSSRLESTRESRAVPDSVVHPRIRPYLRARGMCCQEASLAPFLSLSPPPHALSQWIYCVSESWNSGVCARQRCIS